jgi:hypothetical protein
LAWFAGEWRNHPLKRAEKPHSKFSDRKALDGPATRPITPLAVENSVGKLAAPEAPNASTGKRAWRPQTKIALKIEALDQSWSMELTNVQVGARPERFALA